MQSFRQIGPNLWKIGAIQNRYPIVVYFVMSDSESNLAIDKVSKNMPQNIKSSDRFRTIFDSAVVCPPIKSLML